MNWSLITLGIGVLLILGLIYLFIYTITLLISAVFFKPEYHSKIKP